jgi:hypothetical protein
MIRYLKHTEIDKQKWDEALSNSYNKTPFAQSWYLDSNSPNWDALVNDDYLEMMPLTKRKKYGFWYLCQPILCPRLGVFSTISKEPFSIDHYLAAIPSKFKIVDISLNPFNYISGDFNGVQIINKYNQTLALNEPYPDLKKNFTKSHLKNIPRFEKHEGYTIHSNLPLQEFFKLKMETFHDKEVRLSKRDRDIYLQFLKTLNERNQLEIVTGIDEKKEIVGSVCFMQLGFNEVSIQSFNHDKGRKSGFLFHALDRFIQMNSPRETILDFMGSTLPGVREMNLGFGSTETEYCFIRINRMNKLFRKLIGRV